MLNGKFYMGLTANQMTRKIDVVDRQKSSFFWPDETDTVPKTYRKPTSRNGTPQNATTSSPAATPDKEIIPKELFHKQLTSKIEFCDDFHKSPQQSKRNSSTYRSTPKGSLAKQLNTNSATSNDTYIKPNTFVSKIEFYDYDEMPAAVTSTPVAKRYDEVERKSQKSPNSPKNNQYDRNKKITFDDSSLKKSILKNNENRPSPNVEHTIAIDRLPQFKKNIVSKRNLSKSVENIAKLEISSDNTPIRNNTINVPVTKDVHKVMVKNKEPQSGMEYRQEQEEHYSTSSNRHSNYEEPSKVVQKSRKTVRNDYAYQDNHGTNNRYSHEETFNDLSDHNGHTQRQTFNNRSTDNRRYSNQTACIKDIVQTPHNHHHIRSEMSMTITTHQEMLANVTLQDLHMTKSIAEKKTNP